MGGERSAGNESAESCSSRFGAHRGACACACACARWGAACAASPLRTAALERWSSLVAASSDRRSATAVGDDDSGSAAAFAFGAGSGGGGCRKLWLLPLGVHASLAFPRAADIPLRSTEPPGANARGDRVGGHRVGIVVGRWPETSSADAALCVDLGMPLPLPLPLPPLPPLLR
jgi:hypothetical protein